MGKPIPGVNTQPVKPRICFVGPMLGSHEGRVPSPIEELVPRLEASGYDCFLTSRHVNRFRRLADILMTIFLQREHIDIICLQVYGFLSFFVEDMVSWLGRKFGCKVIMVLRGGDMPSFMRSHPTWTRRVLNRAHLIVAPSPYLAEELKPYCFSIRVIPNAVNLDDYPYTSRRRVRPRLLWMRTFHDCYNPVLAVKVLRGVKSTYPEATLLMAGQDDGLLQATRFFAQESGLGESVKFVGFLDRRGKQEIFPQQDIFLNTNRVDNTPVSVLEAAAFGLPIVATKVGGIPFLLTHEENALLVNGDDVEDMLEAVLRLLRDDNLALKLSRNARRLVELFDWSQVISQWEKIFLEVMDLR